MSTLVPLSWNSRGQVSSSPAGVTSWSLRADAAADCARNPAEHATAAASAIKRKELNRSDIFMVRWIEVMVSMCVGGDEVRLAEREVSEQGFGSADRSPGLPSGPQTKNRDHSDATRPDPLAQATLRYSLFFVSYVLTETDRRFTVLHN